MAITHGSDNVVSNTEIALYTSWLYLPWVVKPLWSPLVDLLGSNGLKRGENGLRLIMMCELPSNAILADQFLEYFDGFSIGSNDLTQLTLGVDRDSAIVAESFDEQDPGMLKILKMAVEGARRNKRHSGICGQAPSDHIEVARYLVELGIDSISLTPDRVLQTMQVVQEIEAMGERAIVSGHDVGDWEQAAAKLS